MYNGFSCMIMSDEMCTSQEFCCKHSDFKTAFTTRYCNNITSHDNISCQLCVSLTIVHVITRPIELGLRHYAFKINNNYSFQQFFLLFPKLIILSTKHPTISLIYIAVLKIIISYLYMKSKKDLWFSQLAKGIFNELLCYGYE